MANRLAMIARRSHGNLLGAPAAPSRCSLFQADARSRSVLHSYFRAGLARVRREAPTLEEAIAAARGLSNELNVPRG